MTVAFSVYGLFIENKNSVIKSAGGNRVLGGSDGAAGESYLFAPVWALASPGSGGTEDGLSGRPLGARRTVPTASGARRDDPRRGKRV